MLVKKESSLFPMCLDDAFFKSYAWKYYEETQKYRNYVSDLDIETHFIEDVFGRCVVSIFEDAFEYRQRFDPSILSDDPEEMTLLDIDGSLDFILENINIFFDENRLFFYSDQHCYFMHKPIKEAW